MDGYRNSLLRRCKAASLAAPTAGAGFVSGLKPRNPKMEFMMRKFALSMLAVGFGIAAPIAISHAQTTTTTTKNEAAAQTEATKPVRPVSNLQVGHRDAPSRFSPCFL